TGADKAGPDPSSDPWTRDLANNLDLNAGAGRADYQTSLEILQGGERSTHAVVGSTIPGARPSSVSTNSRGWAFDMSMIGGDHAVVFRADDVITQLTATLTWNVTQTETFGIDPLTGVYDALDTTDGGRVFADLSLELRPLSVVDDEFELGALLDGIGLSSDASDDNLEHLYFSGTPLAPGYYAMVIGHDPDMAIEYGLAYDLKSIAVSEPMAAPVALAGLTALWAALGLRRLFSACQ
ncbi:MAG: hypothetical protein ACREIT_10550, partial [Tepidisphaeraceae bacterium]